MFKLNLLEKIAEKFKVVFNFGYYREGDKNNFIQISTVLEKEDKIDYEKLIIKYSYGYLIFAIDQNQDKVKLVPGPMHLSDDYEINWNNSGVYKLTSEVIGIDLPSIKFKAGGGCQNVGIEIHRLLNIPQRSPLQWSGIVFDLYVELLKDNGHQLIVVLGLKAKQ